MVNKIQYQKSSSIKLFIGLIISAFIAIGVNAQTVDKTRQLDLLVRLDHAKSMIQSEDYTESQRILHGVLTQLRDERKAVFSQFFPKGNAASATGLDDVSHHAHSLDPLSDDSLDILFSAQYSDTNNDHQYSVDINMVRNDPEIDEIAMVIQKPSLIETLDTVAIVKIQDRYTGVEEYYSEEKYHEINLILEEKVLLNIVANGIVDRQHLLKFCDQIQLDDLVRELN
ncbi:hypothetical protein CL648_05290 [bacterium]|nr:hypothetical protein [bacterium]|tara:strand:+ start:3712 stop:4392 length:681 start_codon:yes stop_codon:yes gene_type:complete